LLIFGVPFFATASLQTDISSLLKTQSPPKTQWGILFEELNSGKALYSQSPNERLIPASNMKIVSGAAALLGLGADFQYETTLYSSGAHIDNKLTGHLIVTGTGDPSIGGRFNGGNITEVFKQWAAELKQKKITVITGDLVGIDHAFDDERYGLNWNPLDYTEWYAAEISALTLNDACIDILITGSSKSGSLAAIQTDPPTSYLKITNQVTTVASSKEERMIQFIREKDSRELTIRGKILAKKRIREYTSVMNPTLFFLTVLKETLQKEGIEIQGEIRIAPRGEYPLKHQSWVELAKHKSPPFSVLLNTCLKNSQNLYSEHFLKTLGFRGYGKGSLKTGTLVIKDIYFTHGCKATDKQYIADGSGLSRDNQISPQSLVDILQCMNKSPVANVFKSALPQAGINGTLKHRMKDNAAYQHVYAKTGTLTGVRALSGYLKAASGKEYAFSIIANGSSSGNKFNGIIDDVCALVVEQG
jgi:D-alanyl-D-alanine carboxypeptidase/D-alanyl-D-alanine-endopeptidase (penicillin-binding protein 4)